MRDSQTQIEVIGLNYLRCTAQYLCDKPNGKEFCHLVNGDFKSCMYFDETNIMYIPPEEILCVNAYTCKYAGKRSDNCDKQDGHTKCGTTINGDIPEGNLPEGLIERLRRAISLCNIRQQ